MQITRSTVIRGATFVAVFLLTSTVHAAPIFSQTPSRTTGFPSDQKGDVLIADDGCAGVSHTSLKLAADDATPCGLAAGLQPPARQSVFLSRFAISPRQPHH